MLLGIASLLGTISGASRLSVLISFLVVIIGVIFAVIAVTLNKRSVYFFIATFFLLMGLFLFLSSLHIIPASLSELWPLVSVIAGLSLITAGWHRYGSFRPWYMVPAIAFVVLGCILLMFSFNVVPFSFSHFVLKWWPLILVLAGLVLVLVSLGTRNKTEDTRK